MKTSSNPRIRVTIGTKLITLISLLLVGSLAVLAWFSTRMFVEDNTALIQHMNAETAESLATRVRDTFKDLMDKSRILGMILVQDSIPKPIRDRTVEEFFSKDSDFLAVAIHKDANTPAPVLLPMALSSEMATQGDPDGAKMMAAIVSDHEYSVDGLSRGTVQVIPFHMIDGTAALAIGIPLVAAEGPATNPQRFTHTLTAVIRSSKFNKAVSEGETLISYMVDGRGRLLAHPDANRAAAYEDLSQVDVVRMMLQGKAANSETRYQEPNTNEWKLGSFKLVGFAGLGVITETPESKAFEAAENVKRRSTYFALGILSVAIFAGYAFSRRIAKRIHNLADAAQRISQGDFAINLSERGRDEVARLSSAFNNMAKGLEERDRVKSTFNKFHNKEVADKLLAGDVKLGGERKEATIFFSDIRGFTAMSEAMEPEEVVEMLNEYMTRMVSIIRSNNGVVDKYVGDSIMAVWGVPFGGTPGSEEDATHAVKACLAMRAELARLNKVRTSRGHPALKVGMGLNTGSVIAGNIGSEEKMEYTVIGDSVNLASRLESVTKEYGTDLLVSKSVQERLKGMFVFETCPNIRAKGKSAPIEVFKVKGYIDASGREVLVETPYSNYPPERSEKTLHDAPAPIHVPPLPSSPLPQVGQMAYAPEPPASAVPAAAQIRTVVVPPAEMPPLPAARSKVTPVPVPAAPPMDNDVFTTPREWFALNGAEALGPLTETQVHDAVARGVFNSQTMLANNALGPWRPLAEFSKFRPENTQSGVMEFADLGTVAIQRPTPGGFPLPAPAKPAVAVVPAIKPKAEPEPTPPSIDLPDVPLVIPPGKKKAG